MRWILNEIDRTECEDRTQDSQTETREHRAPASSHRNTRSDLSRPRASSHEVPTIAVVVRSHSVEGWSSHGRPMANEVMPVSMKKPNTKTNTQPACSRSRS